MKRVVKSSVSGFDKLMRVEAPRYDADWQEHRIQEIADYLDSYGIDIEIDSVIDKYVYFVTYSPKYPKVGKHLYAVCSSGVIYSETSGDTSTYNDGSRRGYNTYVGEKEKLLYRELYARFNVYYSTDSRYIDVAQSYIDELMSQLDSKYGTYSDIVASKLNINYIYSIWIFLDDASFISINGYKFKFGKDFLKLENYNSQFRFLQNMTPESFKALLEDSNLPDILSTFIYTKLRTQFLHDTDILSEAIDVLNDKLANSKYDVYIESFSHFDVQAVLTYDDEDYPFDVDYYSNPNIENQTFNLWFEDPGARRNDVVNYMVKTLYKRIIAKCRRIVAKVNKDIERADQEARDSAML